jgi:hypothetical protein
MAGMINGRVLLFCARGSHVAAAARLGDDRRFGPVFGAGNPAEKTSEALIDLLPRRSSVILTLN